jgi:hypothetical protein
MNKAFVRDPDPSVEYCPHCGSPGQPVGQKTVEAHVPDQSQRQIAEPANFCATPSCDVAYFDGFERVVLTSALAGPIYPKDPAAPICACFGLTCDDIDQDIAEGTVARTKAMLERAKSADANCPLKSPSGRSCVADVQRYYMKHRGGS